MASDNEQKCAQASLGRVADGIETDDVVCVQCERCVHCERCVQTRTHELPMDLTTQWLGGEFILIDVTTRSLWAEGTAR